MRAVVDKIVLLFVIGIPLLWWLIFSLSLCTKGQPYRVYGTILILTGAALILAASAFYLATVSGDTH